MKKIKVIELIQEISEGGAETLVKDYALHLGESQFDVTILTEFPVSVKSANVRVLLSNNKRILAPFGVSKESFIEKVIRKIRKLIIPLAWQNAYRTWFVKHQILKIQPDVIHVHLKMLKYLAPLSERLKETKLFYTCHNLPHFFLNTEDCLEEWNAAKVLIRQNNLRMVGLHEEMKQELNAMFGVENSIVINNCVDLSRFTTNTSNKEVRNKIGIPESAFVIGHVGRFCYQKNQPFIIDVFKHVLEQRSNAHLLLIGDGDTTATINKLQSYGIVNKCTILSRRADIPDLLHAMDVFVFPSQFEGLGIACIEAQAVGLRCVISDKVPKEVFFSEDAVPMSLHESPQKWTDNILDKTIKGPYSNDINDYDVSRVMKTISELYR